MTKEQRWLQYVAETVANAGDKPKYLCSDAHFDFACWFEKRGKHYGLWSIPGLRHVMKSYDIEEWIAALRCQVSNGRWTIPTEGEMEAYFAAYALEDDDMMQLRQCIRKCGGMTVQEWFKECGA